MNGKVTWSILCFGLLLLSNGAFAQRNNGFHKGQSDMNLGIGFVTFNLTGDVAVPPLSVSYEYGITDHIGLGAYVGYSASSYNYSTLTGVVDAPIVDFTYSIFTVRGSYHFDLKDDFDTYVGLMMGYNSANIDYDESEFGGSIPNFSAGGVVYGFHAGGRYHFTKNLGAFLEIGYGVSAVNLGLTTKF